MNSVVVDFQGFKDEKNNFIVKELAVGGIDESQKVFYSRFLFKSPYPFHHLPRRIQIANQWVSRNYHGLRWDEGNEDYERLQYILQSTTGYRQVVLCKGAEKSDFLSRMINREVINMDGVITRRFSKLPVQGSPCHHGRNCAVDNLIKISQWLIKFMPVFETSVLGQSEASKTDVSNHEATGHSHAPDQSDQTNVNSSDKQADSTPLLDEEEEADFMDESFLEDGELFLDGGVDTVY